MSSGKSEKGEKREKQEKSEKSEKGEKAEKEEDDPLGTVFGGLVLIVLGFTFYLAFSGQIEWIEWWAYFITGLGAILLLDALIRTLLPEYRRFVLGRAVGGVILFVVGALNIIGFETLWPLVLIAAGIVVVLYGFLRSR